jgi:hypothetical protein
MSQSVTPRISPAAAPGASVRPSARWWFAGNALVAWAGIAIQAWITIANVYPSAGGKPGEIDYHNQDGLLGTVGHTLDFFTFFTNWSNIAVAVVVTLLALDPWRDSTTLRVLRLSSLLMITVTAIVQAVVLGPDAVFVGWQVPMNALMHQITPVVTVVVWLVVGPRRWIRWSTVPGSLLLPVAWIVWVLARGAVIDGYPYGFVNVHNLGYGQVLVTIAGILALGVVISLVYFGIDVVLSRWQEVRRGRRLEAAT